MKFLQSNLEKSSNLDWDQLIEEEEKIENDLIEKSKSATEQNLTHFIYEYQIGDGYAKYIVEEDNGGEKLTLRHLAIGDAWELPVQVIRGLRRIDIIQCMKFNKLFYNK